VRGQGLRAGGLRRPAVPGDFIGWIGDAWNGGPAARGARVLGGHTVSR